MMVDRERSSASDSGMAVARASPRRELRLYIAYWRLLEVRLRELQRPTVVCEIAWLPASLEASLLREEVLCIS